MDASALVYCENEFGKIDGKVANGLVRKSDKYKILGIIDSTKAGHDAGEYLDGVRNGIPVFATMDEALHNLGSAPRYFIYGIAPLASYIDESQRAIILAAMARHMSIVNGLPEFLSEDAEFITAALEHGVDIHDIRKPPLRKHLHNFSGRILDIETPVITVLGTDCAVGKRTTAVALVAALQQEGINAAFIATGQTGLLQGARYGVAVDVLTSGFSTGEVEHAIMESHDNDHPDIIIVEGQGALSHPAFTSTAAILRGAVPDAIIIQHPPKRRNHCDFPDIPMPTLASEIELVELFANSKVIAITLNHEDMSDDEVESTVLEYEIQYDLPVTDVLKGGCDKLVQKLYEVFPFLRNKVKLACLHPE
ncbi:DUF1611 domain-containing protein [bacterium]|nr:MAG: DUF1611 domain-containing protein [bacterium]RKZ15215.1 MAG: DUF1611 domain-containing protein [bacterium]